MQCCCDNATAVAILKSGISSHSLIMHLMRCLFFFVAYHQLFLDLVHLPGRLNEAADSLSHVNLPHCLQLVPTAQCLPTSLPDVLMEALDTRLGIRRLDHCAAHYFVQGIASSTLRTYRSGHDRFLKFCQLSGAEPFSVSEVVLGGFIAHLADAGLKHQSIKVYFIGNLLFSCKGWPG